MIRTRPEVGIPGVAGHGRRIESSRMTTERTTWPARVTAEGVTWIGLGANAALAVAKVLAGSLLHSRAILADGLHSGSDLVTDVAVLAGLQAARKPPDACHPYGHRRLETLTSMFVGLVLLAAAGWIIYDAVHALQQPTAPIAAGLPFALALLSVPVKEVLFRITRYVGQRTGNVSLRANAWHHRSDAVTSVAAAIGLAAVEFGGPRWAFLDSVTAVVLGAFLVIVAIGIMHAAAAELVDRAPGRDVIESIERAVVDTRGVRGYHAVRARQSGGRVEMDIHVQVDPQLSVAAGHDIATAVRDRVQEKVPEVSQVIVHVEPDPEADSERV